MKLATFGRAAAYVLFLLVAVTIGSEVFLRVLLPEPQGYYIWPPNLHVAFQPTAETTPGVGGDGEFRTNSLGLRSDEPPADRKQTIYVFGGSTAIDMYLDQNHAWVHQLQTKLNAAPGEPKTWVGNLARFSLQSVDNQLIFKYLMPGLPKPDLFLNLVGVNDLQFALKSSYLPEMTLATHMSWTFAEMPATGPFWEKLALVRFYQRIADWWQKSRLGPTQVYIGDGNIAWKRCRREAPADHIVDQLPDLTAALAQYRKNLNELVDQGNAYGATTIFLTQPTIWSDHMAPAEVDRLLAGGIGPNGDWCKEHRYYSPRALADGMARFNRVLLDVCSARHLFCIDVAAKMPKKAEYFQDDMHFTDAGADFISSIVARGILEFQAENGGTLHPRTPLARADAEPPTAK
jgi:lysophospholipase L1-like esterase